MAINGNNFGLALRGRDYQIGNLAAPLPTAMTQEDFEKEKLLVISHMGWRRFSLPEDFARDTREFKRRLKQHLKEDRLLDALQNTFLDSQLTKLFLFDTGNYNHLRDELVMENALDCASKSNIPVIITIPSEFNGTNTKFTALEGSVRDYLDYINSRVTGKSGVYILPTHNFSGLALEDGPEFKIDKNGVASREVKLIPSFGNVTNFPWKEVYFAGGAVDGCLRGTASYFDQQPSINFLDNCCFLSDEPTIEPSKEDEEILRGLVRRLVRAETEQQARMEATKILRKYENPKSRIEAYRDISRIVSHFARDEIRFVVSDLIYQLHPKV